MTPNWQPGVTSLLTHDLREGDGSSQVARQTAESLGPCGAEQQCLVQVWFGRHVICEYGGALEAVERYAAAMRRRFPGVTVTIGGAVEGNQAVTGERRMRVRRLSPLPEERMWELVPR